eukprot:GHVR01136513.1.p1 GENE.GHVR01136513.1~~GHVR01136513.1.p1  ORF type:complete len:166 (+),score=17.78 GHVR01136513.1:3-500(+)
MRDLQVGKSKDIRELIASRIDMWEAHRYDELLEDAETCARALARAKKGKTPTSEEELVRKFSRLMWLGNTRAAVRLVTEENTGGILEMNDEVFKNLQAKHPSQATPPLTALLQPENMPPLRELHLTGEHVLQAARRSKGGAGPGGTTADQWQDLLLRHGKIAEQG